MSNEPLNSGKKNYKLTIALTVISLCLFGLILFLLIFLTIHTIWIWIGNIVVMVLLLIGLGLPSNAKWYGAIVDGKRNRMSLSLLQITLWTIIVIPAFLSIALTRTFGPLNTASAEEVSLCKVDYIANISGVDLTDLQDAIQQSEENLKMKQFLTEAEEECVPQPLKIIFPEELLLVLGISTASFAGSSLIKINQSIKPSANTRRLQSKALDAEYDRKVNEKLLSLDIPDRSKVQENITNAQETVRKIKEKLTNYNQKDQGLLYVADGPKFTDIFYGDQEGNHNYIDLGKVQMFFVTVAILVSYGVEIIALLRDQALILAPFGVSFPLITSSMATLLAISHAGYLAIKAPDQPNNSEVKTVCGDHD